MQNFPRGSLSSRSSKKIRGVLIDVAGLKGVETLPDFRGKGCAREVTAEWARRVRAAGAIPMYSTSWENKASQAVARKLHLNCYGADFHLA